MLGGSEIIQGEKADEHREDRTRSATSYQPQAEIPNKSKAPVLKVLKLEKHRVSDDTNHKSSSLYISYATSS